MGKIRLDDRLAAVASFVREGSRVADIGTDHGYLLGYLLENRISPWGIAADINRGPLENARKTLLEHNLIDRAELILSDGLKGISENSCDDIVIAGMGGNLIADILKECSWIFNEKLNIIAQPMSHAEVLRSFFVENGFEIKGEKTAKDTSRLYCIICARYTGKQIKKDCSYIYHGELLKNTDATTKAYLNKIIFTLEKKLRALTDAGRADEGLGETVKLLKEKYMEAYNADS